MLIIRHGQSEFNKHFREVGGDPGIEDAPLTLLGYRQTERIVREVRENRRIERLITSPYTRALQTAAMIAEALSLPVEVDPLVREPLIYVSDIGSTASQLAVSWPRMDFSELDDRWWEDEVSVERRAEQFIGAMGLSDEVAIVTHLGFIRAVTGEYLPNGGCTGW